MVRILLEVSVLIFLHSSNFKELAPPHFNLVQQVAMLSSITVVSARYDVTGQKVSHLLPANTLDEAFVLLEQEECYYNFASIEIRREDFVYTITQQNRVFRALDSTHAPSDRRRGCDRRTLGDRRSAVRGAAADHDRRRATDQ